jgi:hypothetical protein
MQLSYTLRNRNVSHSAQHSTLAALALTRVALTGRRLVGNFAHKAAHSGIIGSAVGHDDRQFVDSDAPNKRQHGNCCNTALLGATRGLPASPEPVSCSRWRLWRLWQSGRGTKRVPGNTQE